MKFTMLLIGTIAVVGGGIYMLNAMDARDISYQLPLLKKTEPIISIAPTAIPIPTQHEIPQKTQVYQTFNNCGPASLAMLLSYNNISVTQDALGQKLRPYQNANGDNDDKSVSIEELTQEAETYGLVVYHRRHGSVETLKKLIASDIPVLVRTWLHPGEDIGHYRIVRGYDDMTDQFIQDDSYQGENLRFDYKTFQAMWQPFSYEYLVAIPKEKNEIIKEILGDDVDERVAWENAYSQAQTETQDEPTNPYPVFNQVVALYHMGEYESAGLIYDRIKDRLPARMLWYQIEPIQVFFSLGDYDQVFSMTNRILNNNNRAYSELYIIRGKAYKELGDVNAARGEFEKAIFYNKNQEEGYDALNALRDEL